MSAVERRFGLVPAAVTPLRFSDLLAGVVRHLDGTGRDDLRRAMASQLGVEHVATYPSFRLAICACLRELRSVADDGRNEVVIPAYACPDFYAAIEGAGLDVVCCDVDPATLAIDPESALEALTEDTLGMIAVNHLGFGNRMDVILDLCEDNGVHLVEDLGYSLGTEFEGRPLGTFGDGAVLNFKEGKAVPVGGGMVTSNREWFEPSDQERDPISQNFPVLFGYKVFGQPTAYALFRFVSSLLEESGVLSSSVSTHPQSKHSIDYTPPYSTMSAFQGGVGRRVLDRLDDHRRQRAQAAEYYQEQLAQLDGVQMVHPVPGVSNVQYIRYPILVEGEKRRADVRSALRSAGIETSALYSSLSIDADANPNSERVRREIVTLPTHPYVTRADRRRTVDVVKETAGAT